MPYLRTIFAIACREYDLANLTMIWNQTTRRRHSNAISPSAFMNYRILCHFLVVVLLSGCAATPDIAEKAPQAVSRSAEAPLQTYRGNRFTFGYPTGWSVSPMPQLRELDSRDAEGVEIRSPDGSARVLIASLGNQLTNCYVRFADVFRVESTREESVLGWGPYRDEMGGWTEGLINGVRGAQYENCIAERGDTIYVRILTSGEDRNRYRNAFLAIESSFRYLGLPTGFKPARAADAPIVDSTTFATHRFRSTVFATPSNWKLHTVSESDDGGVFSASSADVLATVSVAHYPTPTDTTQSALKHHRDNVLPALGKITRASPLTSYGRHRNGAGIEVDMLMPAGLDGKERTMNVRIYFLRTRDRVFRLETYLASDATQDRKRIVRQIEDTIETVNESRPTAKPKQR
jgi:hypothetical protein